MNPLAISQTQTNPPNPLEKPRLLIKSTNNAKPLNDMFDFTSKRNRTSKFHVLEPVILGMDNRRPFCIAKNKPWEKLESKKGKTYSLSISKTEDQEHFFEVDVPGSFVEFGHPERETWLAVGTLRTSDTKEQVGYELSVGDVIKMGRERYRIAELRQWVNEDKEKLMEHCTYHHSVLGKTICLGRLG